ncbi:LysR substrate-binding domain-containing protein [Cocleimonas flava]|jgi:DNA-binding transcriptional LysR family regulator|uniref:LysR family transcriptional regulator n=1 Tax=Cocleimonas flava TaxID=634765 RepID=A0A4R1F0X7_9GAMM|nr:MULTISPECIES: LysR family transcriptional regulator [Cocleimonas]MEB8434429.1 LysR family transcriptional regulator [Cocleimonas sp. KMM 6892]MEC4717322.1 LysR family transcriptional regulator [Cocleimonas sp. KMM 6895]MEC4746701.1 LysR family transcriptional regulator [Cocleimonas sp. KMM 6896]TCJ87463.1 LysR family transcriptional regulator [Cocleimonas flava]
MNLNWIEDFLTLSNCGNFRIASEQRFVSQPAFSRRILSLETWVGATLIDRSRQPVYLTEAGELFKPVAQEIVRLAYLSRNDIQVKKREKEEKIRFATLSTLAQYFIPSWLKSIQENIESELFSVRTDFANVEDYLGALDEGEADFFICYEDPTELLLNDMKKYSSLQLGVEVLVPVVSPDSNGEPRWWLPSNPQKVIPYLQTQYTSSLLPVKHHLDSRYRNLKFLSVYQSTIAASLCAMAREGYGVAWVPLSIAINDLDKGLLVRAGDENDEIKLVIKIYRNANIIPPQAEKIWQMLLHKDSRF